MDDFIVQGLKIILVIFTSLLVVGGGAYITYLIWKSLKHRNRRTESQPKKNLEEPQDKEITLKTESNLPKEGESQNRELSEPLRGNKEAIALLNNFFEDIKKLSDSYLMKLNELEHSLPQSNAPTVPVTYSYNPLKNQLLLAWWNNNGHQVLDECIKTLKNEFGQNLDVMVINQQNARDWNIIGVKKEENEFYLFPRRKVGWSNNIFGEWFKLEEEVIEGTPINTIKSFTRAVKNANEWQQIGRKGIVSTR